MIDFKITPIHRLKAQSFRMPKEREENPDGFFESINGDRQQMLIYEYTMYCDAYYESGQTILNYSAQDYQITCEECQSAYGLYLLQTTDLL